MGINRIALLWGFAEATLFFIVPDVWLSFVGREKLSKGIRACFYAFIGAWIGGAIMFSWGKFHVESAIQTVEKIPGIHHSLIIQTENELKTQGVKAILLAPLKGVPYKIYALQAAQQNIALIPFLLITIPARLLRFLATTVACHYALKWILGRKTAKIRQRALLLGWIIFYTIYFIRMNG